MSYPTRDWLKKSAAHDLAQQIQAYWAMQGKKVRIRVEEYSTNQKGDGCWSIRSDMIAGSPRP
jgi:hypothetical protein